MYFFVSILQKYIFIEEIKVYGNLNVLWPKSFYFIRYKAQRYEYSVFSWKKRVKYGKNMREFGEQIINIVNPNKRVSKMFYFPFSLEKDKLFSGIVR